MIAYGNHGALSRRSRGGALTEVEALSDLPYEGLEDLRRQTEVAVLAGAADRHDARIPRSFRWWLMGAARARSARRSGRRRSRLGRDELQDLEAGRVGERLGDAGKSASEGRGACLPRTRAGRGSPAGTRRESADDHLAVAEAEAWRPDVERHVDLLTQRDATGLDHLVVGEAKSLRTILAVVLNPMRPPTGPVLDTSSVIGFVTPCIVKSPVTFSVSGEAPFSTFVDLNVILGLGDVEEVGGAQVVVPLGDAVSMEAASMSTVTLDFVTSACRAAPCRCTPEAAVTVETIMCLMRNPTVEWTASISHASVRRGPRRRAREQEGKEGLQWLHGFEYLRHINEFKY